MAIFTVLYDLIIEPLWLLFDVVYAYMLRFTDNEGIAIIALSLAINFLTLPLYRRADAMQEEEKLRTQKLQPGVAHIKKAFKGDERFMMLQTYYRQNNYKPYYGLKGSLSLLLEIPFFIAAYNYLSGLDRLRYASFGPISDLCMPDGLLHIAGHSLNLLPSSAHDCDQPGIRRYLYKRDAIENQAADFRTGSHLPSSFIRFAFRSCVLLDAE